ncbi:hypothetical protein KAW18_09345 [candidate division WOR-3 bacterium]|nr:hypothetical protein [candidate division WOR-3 bacterium]MCK4527562.1 hypothetical protein [candidate division WOR-3 bacterium]
MSKKIKIIAISTIGLLILVSLSVYPENKEKIDVKVLECEKVVFGKWGDNPGEFSIRWEDGLPYDGPEIRPAIDKEGNIYLYDILNKRVSKYSKGGELLLSFKLNKEQLDSLRMRGITMDKNENLYVGNLVFSKQGMFIKSIHTEIPRKEVPFIDGILEKGELLVSTDVYRYAINPEGKVIRKGEEYQRFTPINGKDYTLSSGPRKGRDKKDFILKIYDKKKKRSKELSFKVIDSLINKVVPQRLIPIRISIGGYVIVVCQRFTRNTYYIVFYIDENRSQIVKAYVLPSEVSIKGVTFSHNPPVFGLDGNIYQSGYSAKEEDPEYGGYWVKRYIIPDEDKPR